MGEISVEGEASGHWLRSALLEMGIGALVGAVAGAVGARVLAWTHERDWTEEEHIRLAVGRKDSSDQVALRIRVDDAFLDAVLAAIVRHQDRVTPTDFTVLAIDLIGAAPEVLLETGRAQRARLGRAAGSA